MAKFEVPTFFHVGFCPSEEEARQLADAMPPIYNTIGHFTISSHPDRFGWYSVYWECHKLPQARSLIELPFRVETVETVCGNKGLPIPMNTKEKK